LLFNSIEFIVFFIFVLCLIIIFKNRQFQHIFLLGSSYFFFFFSSNFLITLLIFSTLLDFYIGKAIFTAKNQRTKKMLLVSSLAGNLGLLGFFKYADFGIKQINQITNNIGISEIPALELILPIGISFYTFQTISYTVDVYRGKLEPSKSFFEFALFVSFFPQLVAGPIIRAKDFLPQLREKIESSKNGFQFRQIILTNNNLKFGISLMALGFFKKMFFADNIGVYVNEIFANPIGLDSFTIWLGTIGFGIQIYCDFSGYSDIAIGAAAILGFKIPKNFNKPYFASSPSDFWRRWHISLSTWLRDYLYIPLGGNKKSESRTYLNLAIVMFLGGLWHGASWNFVIWGLLHGIYLSIHKLLVNKFPVLKNNRFFKTRIGKIISIAITQYLVFLAWIPFRVRDTEYMTYSMEKFVFYDFNFDQVFSEIIHFKLLLIFLVLFIVLHFISYKKQNIIEIINNFSFKYYTLFLTIIITSIILFFDAAPHQFIYFRF
jgi:alginate O-acetyltransferase complex protein AlgI